LSETTLFKLKEFESKEAIPKNPTTKTLIATKASTIKKPLLREFQEAGKNREWKVEGEVFFLLFFILFKTGVGCFLSAIF
jgi:hypothetical protein